MKKARFTESQIVTSIKKQESGVPVRDLCRELGISDATFYNWKAKYGGMEVNDRARPAMNSLPSQILTLAVILTNIQSRKKSINLDYGSLKN